MKIIKFSLFFLLLFNTNCKVITIQTDFLPLKIHAHNDYIYDSCFYSNDKYAISISNDTYLKIWEFKSIPTKSKQFIPYKTICFPDMGLRKIAVFSEHFILIGNNLGNVYFYDLNKEIIIDQYDGPNVPVSALTITHDNKLIGMAFNNGQILVLNKKKEKLFELDLEINSKISPIIAFCPDNRFVAISHGYQVKIFKIDNWSEIISFAISDSTFGVHSMIFTSDGSYLLTGAHIEACLWNFIDGKLIRRFHGHFGKISSIAVSTNNKMIATGGGLRYFDSTIKLWNFDTSKEICELTFHEMPISAVHFSMDNRFLLSSSFDETIVLTDIEQLTNAIGN